MPLSRLKSLTLPTSAMAFTALSLLALPATASQIATGMQYESWKNVDLDLSKNPAHKNDMESKIGFNHLEFDMDGMVNYYIEEPGLIFGLISGLAGNEAAEINARNEAIQKGEHVYHWNYVQPPSIPQGRWFRWGYTHGFASGGKRVYHRLKLSDGKDSLVNKFDPTLRLDYIRIDANHVTAPNIIGNSDFFWMIGSDFSGTSMKIYGSGVRPGDDWSFATMPLNLHMGWQPSVFPYLMVDVNGGIDILDPIGNLFLGFKNYVPYSEFGMRASLGTDWLTFYYDISHQVDPLWDYDEYNRRYTGLWSVFGTRLDIGNLIIKMLK